MNWLVMVLLCVAITLTVVNGMLGFVVFRRKLQKILNSLCECVYLSDTDSRILRGEAPNRK